jgi:hypothetical protein
MKFGTQNAQLGSKGIKLTKTITKIKIQENDYEQDSWY